MRTSIPGLFGLAVLLSTAAPAMAQDTAPPKAFTISGNAQLTSDYRFRGLTQSDEDPALQGSLTVTHESGFYVGTFASTIDDKVSLPGYGGAEVDLYAGYGKSFANGLGVDAGLLYYYYPDGANGAKTDFFEPYAALTYTIGPVSAKLGAAYAWSGQKGLIGKKDNIYGYLDLSAAIPSTPLTVKGHVGYSDGSLGFANLDPLDDSYIDWSIGVEGNGGPFRVGVSYVDTDVNKAFANTRGSDATVLGYIAFAF